MRNTVLIALTVVALAGCTAKQGQTQKQGDSGPDKDSAISQIQARLYSRGYVIPFPRTERLCTQSFDMSQFEIIDRRVEPDLATLKVAVVLTAREDVESDGWVAMNCFGGPWAKGQAANHVEDFTFQKWSSGWVLQ